MKEGAGNLVSSHNVVIDNGSNTTKVYLIFFTLFIFIILSYYYPSHNNQLGHTQSIIIINVNSHRLASQQRIVPIALYQQPLEGGDTKAQWR